ncbi:MAG: MFS transporter [Gammaproteobacteria bacterium]|nr:MFS transporter [Gammaproteobacteria bacterium]MCI0590870.1 MFS transporter [Gammaproteobacteria bacterium]
MFPRVQVPYWRLSGFYLFYFSTLGALLPYWSPYLQSLGFGAVEIGELVAILVATKIVAPNVWGWLADHRGRRMAIIRLACLLACIAFAAVLLASTFIWLALVMVVFGFFWNAALPQFEATTLTHLGDSVHAYTQIRVWGSVGFIVSVWMLGWIFDRYGVHFLPQIIVALMGMIWLTSLLVPEEAAGHLPLSQEPLRKVLARPKVLALLIVCFLMQASHGPYYAFYSIYLADHGYSPTLIGELWALGVLAEVGVFLAMHRLLRKWGLRTLLLASLGLATLRWLLIGFYVDSLPVLTVAQLLHAATFGVYHAMAIQLIHRYFVGRHQGRGQALYSSTSFGAGLAVGSLLSGFTWASFGPERTYAFAALLSLVGLGVAWRWVRTEG